MDLMSFRAEDEQPSVFVLQQDRRYSVVAVFNWTKQPRSHRLGLAELGIQMKGPVTAYDIFDRSRTVELQGDKLVLENEPPHSVRMIRLADTSVAEAAPGVSVKAPRAGEAGEEIHFAAEVDPDGVPALRYRWHFGDGTTGEGKEVAHAYTFSGDFLAALEVDGVDGVAARVEHRVQVSGSLKTPFRLENSRRFVP